MTSETKVKAAGCHLFGHCNCHDHIKAKTCCWCGTARVVVEEGD